MKLEIKNMMKEFTKLGEAKKKSSLYVKMVTALCAVVVLMVLIFMNITIGNVTSKILVVNTGGEFLKLKSVETDQLYKTLLQSHCKSVCYYANSFDRLNITSNQAQAMFLAEKTALNAIFQKYLKDRAYADAAERGIVYKCVFDKIQRLEVRGDEYNVIFTSTLSIYDGRDIKNIRIISRGDAIRTTPVFPENVTGFFFRTYTQEYEIITEKGE